MRYEPRQRQRKWIWVYVKDFAHKDKSSRNDTN